MQTTAANFYEDQVAPHIRRLNARAKALNRRSCDAEDLLQDTLERALLRADCLIDNTDPSRWLLRIMFNLFANDWRRKHSRVGRACQLDESQVEAPPPYEPCDWELITREDIAAAISRLPPAFRETSRLNVLEERSYQEIARKQRISVQTVGSRLHRARRLLEKDLSRLQQKRLDKTLSRGE